MAVVASRTMVTLLCRPEYVVLSTARILCLLEFAVHEAVYSQVLADAQLSRLEPHILVKCWVAATAPKQGSQLRISSGCGRLQLPSSTVAMYCQRSLR